MFVKICGLTRVDEAVAAADAGADAIGFLFAESKRRVTPEQAAAIAAEVPDRVLTVGVFRGAGPDEVLDVVTRSGVRGIQLSGWETPADVTAVRGAVGFVMKAFSTDDPQLAHLDDYDVDAVMLDAAEPGSGRTFDWTAIDDDLRRHRIVLAGGLTTDNVARAIETVRPWGVDVSTGVESAPGRKDRALVATFIERARAAASTLEAASRSGGPGERGPVGEVSP